MANAYKIKLKEDRIKKILDGNEVARALPYGIKRNEAVSFWVSEYSKEEKISTDAARNKLYDLYRNGTWKT